jgi:hypothetical protein
LDGTVAEKEDQLREAMASARRERAEAMTLQQKVSTLEGDIQGHKKEAELLNGKTKSLANELKYNNTITHRSILVLLCYVIIFVSLV